ncbi:MAG: MBL fold metallo-hydrolase [Erysipelotrichales bacterium]|nr:MBL fold metallo-hydrolase [Erysipelotrichales bacterium]
MIVRVDTYKHLLLYNTKASVGDTIQFQGELEYIDSLHNYGLFDYTDYMRNKGIYQCISTDTVEILKHSYLPHAILYRYVYTSRLQEIASSFLYNDHEEDTLAIFFSSGMHFSFLLYHITKISSFYLYSNKVKIIELLCSLLLHILFPYSYSVTRLFLMRILKYYESNYSKRIALGMMLLLIIRPYQCTSLGFIIPFILSISSLYLQNIPRFLTQILVLSPIQAATQYEVNIFWMLAFPLLRNLYSLFFVLILLGLVFPFTPYIALLEWLYMILQGISGDMLVLQDIALWGRASVFACILYLVAIFLWKESTVSRKLLLLSIVLYVLPIYGTPWITVTFLDVGQGDCMLVEYPFHQGSVMVDTGGGYRENLASQVLIPYLKSRGIRKLDALIISHYDSDHSGAMEDLLAEIEVEYLIDYTSEIEGVGIFDHTIEFLDITRHSDEENDRSLITLFDLGEYTLLTTGDLSSIEEEQILREYPDLTVDYLKLSHHGSATSSSLYYLARLSPQAAFNSSGRNNIYHHPSTQVLETLQRLSIPLYDTQQKGSIHLCIFFTIPFIYTAIS